MGKIENTHEWHKIGNRLTSYFGICSCQRKLKTIVDNLWSIKQKVIDNKEKGTPLDFTGAEWLVLAMMDRGNKKLQDAICHGINCEYPIIIEDSEFWKWIDEVKNSPYLEDN